MKKRLLPILVVAAFSAQSAQADIVSLYSAWQKAMRNEASWRMAQADTLVDRQEESKALAGLLPNISASSVRSRNDTSLSQYGGSTAQGDYTASTDIFIIRQPLLRPQAFSEYRRAGVRRESTEAREQVEALSLATKVAQAYFDILLAEDSLRFARFQEASLKIRVDGAQKSFKAGTGSRIEIDEAKARLSVATAERFGAENASENARKQLSGLIGSPVTQVIPLDEARASELQLRPATFAEWLELAQQASPELAAAKKAVEEAEWAVTKARSGHLPTMDLLASRSHLQNDTTSTIGTRSNISAIGFQLNIPLYAGGYVDADTAQARALHLRASAEKEGIERDLERRLLREYNGVTQGAERLASLQEALSTNIVALRSTQRGIEAGTRSTLDVLNAERQLYSVRLEAARARYEWIMSRMRLMALAGRLSESEIQAINNLLSISAGQTVEPTALDETAPSAGRPVADIPRDRRADRYAAPRPPLATRAGKVGAGDTPPSIEPPPVEPASDMSPPTSASVDPSPPPAAVPSTPTPEASPMAQVPPVAEPVAAAPIVSPPPEPVQAAAIPSTGESPAASPLPAKPAEAAPPLIPPKSTGRHVVLIGSFANPENVSRLLERLEKVGIPVFTELSGSGLTGIRAGPFPTRKAAESGLKALKAASIPGVLSIR